MAGLALLFTSYAHSDDSVSQDGVTVGAGGQYAPGIVALTKCACSLCLSCRRVKVHSSSILKKVLAMTFRVITDSIWNIP